MASSFELLFRAAANSTGNKNARDAAIYCYLYKVSNHFQY